MTQALFTSMTGLNAGTEQLTCVSDNVANMNTTAYKTSRVDFQDIWYKTKTTGTNSTRTMGGTNPYQIGVGVRCASISKDFSASTTNTTGRADDMALTGNGWFTVLNPDGKVMLTRDGTFALDENGYLCTANGCKVLGMDATVSMINSTTPIKMPTQIKVTESDTPSAVLSKMKNGKLNALGTTESGFTSGTFKVYIGNSTSPITITLDNITESTTVNNGSGSIVDQINSNQKDANGNTVSLITASVVDGAIQFTSSTKVDGKSQDLRFESGSSNFVAVTNLASMPKNTDNTINTKTLNIDARVEQVDDITADTTKQFESYSVGLDGLVTVTYSDGSVLTVRSNDDGSTYFIYQNPNSISIEDDLNNTDLSTSGRENSLYVDPNVLVRANMQFQIAKVANDYGLVAEGNNQYSVGVDCGPVIYTAANQNGTGAIVTGALEASNVDLAQQFANMILAQRLVQANSQVFQGANSMLETLVYLGQ